MHGSKLFLIALRVELGGRQPGCTRIGGTDIYYQCIRGKMDFERECRSTPLVRCGLRRRRSVLPRALMLLKQPHKPCSWQIREQK